MRWLIATPFSKSTSDPWLGRFVLSERHSFESVPADYAHDRSRQNTSAGGWRDYFNHARKALRAAKASKRPVGIITCFPQLPTMLGLLCQFANRRMPIIAWSFNLGALPTGFKRHLARLALRRVNLFVVHSRQEIEACSRWLGLDRSRFLFVPLQGPRRETTTTENIDVPYVLAMGTANRDYALFFSVMRDLGLRTIVVAGRHGVEHLDRPSNVELMSGLSLQECLNLLQGCRVSVIPVANAETASGQVTLLDSLSLGKATVITDCPGSSDYIEDEVTALAVPAGDRAALRDAITRLWEDSDLRGRLSAAARADAAARFSDEAIGRMLGSICDDVELKTASAGMR